MCVRVCVPARGQSCFYQGYSEPPSEFNSNRVASESGPSWQQLTFFKDNTAGEFGEALLKGGISTILKSMEKPACSVNKASPRSVYI